MSDARRLVQARPLPALDERMRGLLRQAASFLGVGGIGFLVDIAIFNLLRATVFDPQHVAGGAILAKAVSTLAAIAVNWIGNRQVTFRRERGARLGREALRFLAASLLGSSVSLACLAISHYALGFTSPAADNLSANVLGLALGTALRFQLYRTWVFPAPAVGAWDPARSRVPTSIP